MGEMHRKISKKIENKEVFGCVKIKNYFSPPVP